MNFKDLLKPVPRTSVFTMKGYKVWCGSMVEQDGTYYLFFSRWADHAGHYAWVTSSEVAYAVAKDPLGPYTFEGVALTGSGGDNWDASTIHNPTVVRMNGIYYMYYMGTKGPTGYPSSQASMSDPEWWQFRNNQRIGVAVANHPTGPWQRFTKPCVDVTAGSFDHLATSNPTVAQGPDGRVYLIYKSIGDGPLPRGGAVVCGVAVADDPLGPFNKMPGPIMVNPEEGWSVEDPFMWVQNEQFYALVKDFQGYFTQRGKSTVALFHSNDGIQWSPSAQPFAFDREVVWEDGQTERMDALERPQVWLRNGKPAVLFCAAARLDDPKRENSFNIHIPLREEAPTE